MGMHRIETVLTQAHSTCSCLLTRPLLPSGDTCLTRPLRHGFSVSARCPAGPVPATHRPREAGPAWEDATFGRGYLSTVLYLLSGL